MPLLKQMQPTNYLHSMYTVFNIVSSPEIRGPCTASNTTPFHMRDLNVRRCWESQNPSAVDAKGHLYSPWESPSQTNFDSNWLYF